MELIIALIMVVGILSIVATIGMFNNNRDSSALIFFIISVAAIISLGLIALNLNLNKEIPAIEVYRDNTMMIVTYQNNNIDSVVVYKNK